MFSNSHAFDRTLSESQEFMHIVRSSAFILQYLVLQLIDLNKIKQGKFIAKSVPVDHLQLYEACNQIMDCYKMQAKQKQLYLKFSKPSI